MYKIGFTVYYSKFWRLIFDRAAKKALDQYSMVDFFILEFTRQFKISLLFNDFSTSVVLLQPIILEQRQSLLTCSRTLVTFFVFIVKILFKQINFLIHQTDKFGRIVNRGFFLISVFSRKYFVQSFLKFLQLLLIWLSHVEILY